MQYAEFVSASLLKKIGIITMKCKQDIFKVDCSLYI